MKKISTILTTGILMAYAPSVYAASTSSRLADLEKRLDKIEKGSMSKDLKISGRLQFDSTQILEDNDIGLENNSRLRRGRIGVKGKLAQDWSYKVEVDFAKDASTVTDAYLKKSLGGGASLKIGQHKEPFSLDELTSSRFISFIERASINGFAPGRSIGVSYNLNLDNINFYAGIYNDDIGSELDTESDDETTSGTARLAFYDKQSNGDTLHLGVAYRMSSPISDVASYKFKPEATVDSSSSVVKTGDITAVNEVTQLGLEAAIVQGPLSVQAEYITTDITRDTGNEDISLDGYYGQVSYFLTGERKNYNTKSSAFSRVKPNNPSGAWEVAYRYSLVDATDSNLNAGEMKNSSLSVNYYATSNVKLMANYISVEADEDTEYGDDAEILAFRAQIDF